MHREARDILPEVLEAIGVCRPILVGHSDGGSISLIHAAEHDVLAVIALAPHVFVEEVCLDAISKLKSTYHSSGLRDRMARHHHDPDVTFSGWADVWLDPVFRSWHLADLLPEIAAPLLVIQGAEDQYGTLAQIDVIQSLVSAPMERLVVPGGHAPHIEQPETVLGAIAHFIRQATD
jgi:pimeloyl-ACP methyl ester carboxylesterase